MPYLKMSYRCLMRDVFKDTLKGFDDFKNKQKSAWSNVFWYVKDVYSESVFNTLYIVIRYKC